MSSRIIAVCDICSTEQEFKISAPVDSAAWDRELQMEGWWSRPDFDEICPKHPRPLAAVVVGYPPGEEGYIYGCGGCAHGERCHCGPAASPSVPSSEGEQE